MTRTMGNKQLLNVGVKPHIKGGIYLNMKDKKIVQYKNHNQDEFDKTIEDAIKRIEERFDAKKQKAEKLNMTDQDTANIINMADYVSDNDVPAKERYEMLVQSAAWMDAMCKYVISAGEIAPLEDGSHSDVEVVFYKAVALKDMDQQIFSAMIAIADLIVFVAKSDGIRFVFSVKNT